MLAQVVLIVFAMCAVLSLIIDIGYARITQAQMQNAADTAALEGLRKSDPATGQPNRAAARDLVRSVFDDDLNPENGDSDYEFGAGPIIDLTGGVTTLHALETISVPDAHVYKPDLQPNPGNVQHGDMVRGTFTSSLDPVPSEDQSYNRTDFTPDVNGTAFLVRLRRSNEVQEPDVASSGPSLPLTFGKASMIRADDPSSTYSLRRDGLTVRATAIAAARPALRVGLPQAQATPPLPGVTPFALRDTFVQTLNAAVPQNCSIASPPAGCVTINPANGIICRVATCTGVNDVNAIGRFVDSLTDSSRSPWKTINTVGQPLPAPVPVICAATNSLAVYGPVWYSPAYSQIASGTNRAANRIIGFARVRLNRPPCPAAGAPPGTPPVPGRPPVPVTSFTAMISRLPSTVAPSNATATLMNGLPLPANAQPADVTELLDKNCPSSLPGCRAGGGVNYGPVLVPVLAR